MKHIYRLPLLVVVSLQFFACQKNTDENNIPQTSPVGFTLGTKARNDHQLLISTSPQSINGLLSVKVQSGTAAAAVKVKLADSTISLVNKYNSTNGTSIIPLPVSRWSMPAELNIATGGTNAAGAITVSNTDGLDVNKFYGIGISIGNGEGYTIPDSSRNLLIVLRITNVMDGRYTMKGRFFHPSLEPGFALHTLTVELHTVNGTTAMLYWPFANMYTSTSTSGGGNPYCCLANQELMITLNTTNNALSPANANPVGPAYSNLQTYNSVSYTNYFDPGGKAIYLAFGRSLGAGGTLNPAISQAWIDTLTYVGPR